MRQTVLVAVALLLSVPILPSQPPARVPVVVELFTSEGCSDCPPADKLLAELDRSQPVPGALIIPLEEHVDYWDHQGWRDPYSSATFTERQEAYARHFGDSGPYTPEMVVAGRTGFVGSAEQKAVAAITAVAAEPPAAEIWVNAGTGTPPDRSLHAEVGVNPLPVDLGESAEVRLAITEDGLASDVSAGENRGRHMEHRAVVRKFIAVGRIEPGKPFTANVTGRIAPEWKRENLRVVVFLEGDSSGKIFGAASAPVAR